MYKLKISIVLIALICLILPGSAASVSASVTKFIPAFGNYNTGDAVISSVNVKNTGSATWTYYVKYSVKDDNGKIYEISTQRVKLTPNQIKTISARWTVPNDAIVGNYRVVMSVWKYSSSNRLVMVQKNNAFSIVSNEPTPIDVLFSDDFTTFDTNVWTKQAFKLERTQFQTSNVDILDGNLRIKMPKGTFDGGEIDTTKLYSYGYYECRMKVPNAPSSITGFFTYIDPDYAGEIDIEVYNDNSGRVDFTIYSNGKMQTTHTTFLGFDPTADFHVYAFDYQESQIIYYVDGKEIWRTTVGIPTKQMYLMINSWYPNWLAGTKTPTDQYLLVDYVKITNMQLTKEQLSKTVSG